MRSCLFSLGLTGLLLKTSLKSLNLTFLKASIVIWMPRDIINWKAANQNYTEAIGKQCKQSHFSENNTYGLHTFPFNKQNIEQVSNFNRNAGLMNKGNTINSSKFKYNVSIFSKSCQSNVISLFTASFFQDHVFIKIIQIYLRPISVFEIPQGTSCQICMEDFDLFQQQNASDIICIIIKVLCSKSVNILKVLKTHVRDAITCSTSKYLKERNL